MNIRVEAFLHGQFDLSITCLESIVKCPGTSITTKNDLLICIQVFCVNQVEAGEERAPLSLTAKITA